MYFTCFTFCLVIQVYFNNATTDVELSQSYQNEQFIHGLFKSINLHDRNVELSIRGLYRHVIDRGISATPENRKDAGRYKAALDDKGSEIKQTATDCEHSSQKQSKKVVQYHVTQDALEIAEHRYKTHPIEFDATSKSEETNDDVGPSNSHTRGYYAEASDMINEHKIVSTDYGAQTALVFAKLSAVAYGKTTQTRQKCLSHLLPGDGFKIHSHVRKPCVKILGFRLGVCFVYTVVSVKRKQIAVVFRGTTSYTQFIEEILSIKLSPKMSFEAGGHVQTYFGLGFNHLYPCLKKTLEDLLSRYPDFAVVVTGHSLGGALASLAAASLVHDGITTANNTLLYTYGMPVVGDRKYANVHDTLVPHSFRVVHSKDIVSVLPTCVDTVCKADAPYHHGYEVFYPNENMTVHSNFIRCHGDNDKRCSRHIIFEDKNCTLNVTKCLKNFLHNHTFYFGFQVGQICRKYGDNDTYEIDIHENARKLISSG